VRRCAFLLAIVAIVAGVVVYVEGRGGGATSQAVQYQHYFDVGKRMCHGFAAGLKPTPAPGVRVVWSGGVVGPFLRLPGIPAKYRPAVTAGCNALV
jgi:hypothetical protein